jgi:hypothetical protein
MTHFSVVNSVTDRNLLLFAVTIEEQHFAPLKEAIKISPCYNQTTNKCKKDTFMFGANKNFCSRGFEWVYGSEKYAFNRSTNN